jgi:transcriptional regulator GlxA family with amidase domain
MTKQTDIHCETESQKVALLLVPGFSLVGLSVTVDPMFVANRLSNRKLYDWSILSIDGRAAKASNGMIMDVDDAISQESKPFDLIIVCAGFFDKATATNKLLMDWLRKQARMGCTIGAISTGAEIMANAGLLDRQACTIHWENEESFRENHPAAILTGGIYELGEKRITAAGGIAALDMMLSWIARCHDEYLVTAIAEQFIHSRSRTARHHQRDSELRLVRRRSPKLAKAIEVMMANFEKPLSTVQIAEKVGTSARQLERLFTKYRNKTPGFYYQELRLNHARYLVFNSGLSLTEISIASGFSSQSHFSRRYKNFFKSTPSGDRKVGHF